MPETDPILDAILYDRPLTQEPKAESEEQRAESTEPQAASTEQRTPDLPTPTPTPTKDPEPAAVPSSDWITEASKSIGMEFKSEDELKNFFTKAKSYDDLESRTSTLNQELEKYKAEANPWANDHIRKLNELVKGGASAQQIQLFNEIESIGEIKSLSPFEAKKLALRYEHDLSPEEAETMLNAQYKLDEDVYDSDVVEAEKIRLKVESQQAFKYLNELQTKSAENPAQAKQADYEAQIAEYTKQVTPLAKSIQESLTALKGVNLNGLKGADAITTDLPVSEESRAQIADLVTQYAVTNNISLDESGKAHLNEFARNVALIANWDNMAIHIASKTEERLRAEFHNPSTIHRGADNPVDDRAIQAKQMEDFVLNSY